MTTRSGTTSPHRPWRRAQGDDGVVVVVLAASIMAMLLLAALLIDIGGGRSARVRNSSAADSAVLAGASRLPPLISSDNSAACTSAWNHILANFDGDVSTAVAPNCDTFKTTCNPTTERTTTASVGRYTFEMTNPVSSTTKLKGRAGNPKQDATPCRRLALRVTEQRDNLFTSGTTTVRVLSVARLGGDLVPLNAPLIVVNETGCRTLIVGGTAKLAVSKIVNNDGVEVPGVIAVDSNGAGSGSGHCTGSDPIMATRKSNGQGQGQIILEPTSGGLPGQIGMFGLSANGQGVAFNPDDVNNGRLQPEPTANASRVGTRFIEQRYNCSPANGCDRGTPPHIDNLVAWLAPAGKPAADANGAFKQFSLSYPSCSSSIIATPIPAGNWWVDCKVSGNGELRFVGPGTVVFDQGIDMKGQGRVVTNCSGLLTTCDPAEPMILYFRDKENFVTGALSDLLPVSPGGGGAFLNETFVYMEEGTKLSLSGNSDIKWTAPNDPTHRFDDLALWTQSTAEQILRGTPGLQLEGTFFAPRAQVTIDGTADMPLQNAQMVVDKLLIDGTGLLTFKADPSRMTLPRGTDQNRGATLIR